MRSIPRSVELLSGTPNHGSSQYGLYNSWLKTRRSLSFQCQFHTISATKYDHLRPHPHALTSPSPSQRHHNVVGNIFIRHAHVHGQQDDYYSTQVDALLAALRQNDAFKLYLCLLDLTRGARPYDADFCRAIRSIPSTTFSEILRSFDPFHIHRHVDSAPGIRISWGAAVYTPLGELINKWGVKILYVRIFNRLRLLQDARRHTLSGTNDVSIRPLLHDYVVLLRCAGATSNIQSAKKVWHELFTDGYALWKNPQVFTEFIKARYLTESLYANNELARFRLRPLDMHRNGATRLNSDQLRQLKHIRSTLLGKYSHRFGQNMHEVFFAEPLTRLLRRRRPLRRLQRRAIVRHMIPGDELLLCAILKALGRQGQGYASNLLMRFWGINITTFQNKLGRRDISGGYDFAAGAAQAPTAALLDAVVHCYGAQGEIPLATALVDFISRRWDLPVPDRVWSDLLAYARIHVTEPAATEWRIAHMRSKVSNRKSVVDIWQLCTQPPYEFQPSMKDYDSLIKSIIRPMRSLALPLNAILQVTPLYHRTVRQVQEAWSELVLTTQQRVSNHAAYRRYRMLLATKHYMWYCFHYMSTQAVNVVKPSKIDDHNAVRLVPRLVAELGPFMTAAVQYRIATGVVDLRLDNAPLKLVESRQTLQQQPELLSERQFFTDKSHSHTSKPTLNNTTGPPDSSAKDRLMDLKWPFSNVSLSKEDSTAALRDYARRSGVGDPWKLEQPDMDNHEMEQDEDEDRHMDLVKDDEVWATQDNNHPHQRDTVANKDGPDNLKGHPSLTSAPYLSETYFQDTFEESLNPTDDSPFSNAHNEIQVKEGPPIVDPLEDAVASIHQDHIDSDATRLGDDRDQGELNVEAVRRRVESRQLLNRPAYMVRPRYNAPAGEPSLSALRQDGQEFTGFHQDPLKVHFAAHRIVREMRHAPGVPVDLSDAAVSEGRLKEHLLRTRT